MPTFRQLIRLFKREIAVYRRVLADPRTPWAGKVFLGAAVGYVLLPFDLIPDWIPILGHLDDLVIVPALVGLALLMIPRGVVQEHRQRVTGDDTDCRSNPAPLNSAHRESAQSSAQSVS